MLQIRKGNFNRKLYFSHILLLFCFISNFIYVNNYGSRTNSCCREILYLTGYIFIQHFDAKFMIVIC